MPIAMFVKSDMGVLKLDVTSMALLAMWEIHYIHRGIIYTYNAPRIAPHSLFVVISALVFNLANGYLNGRGIGPLSSYDANYLTSPRFLIGASIFFIGMAINILSDYSVFAQRRLADAKKHKDGVKDISSLPPQEKYVIPRDGLFELVSCPAYFGEIVEWIGWAVAANCNAGWAFAFFTFANLAPRGVAAHKWYKDTFKKAYPKGRKAVLPFLW
ncbi:hypothetical protein SmJEL517_g06200 [Synchytrium microbalum]|uniref:3-oxo-5-alpha-steroid 4-dehydrogenase C-terminal domain-containing protein n=1 Tax=Synchytrium microbalum TaxID=1806994 RepID=A0A507BWM7_9FUNG|nr:uncharacterized protein SmJEL517_g06200 [Synchytrium microbalum]TPX30176.1 hypothetical protein SmJEL517_g06200 [Synchytrium microbalum]